MECECNCPICNTSFVATCMLPCDHVFCPTCVSQVESLAKTVGRKPACPICSLVFEPSTADKQHPASHYHDELVSLVDPLKEKKCSMCLENVASFICQAGCDYICSDCQVAFHSKMPKTAAHGTVPVTHAEESHLLNPKDCFIHKLPISSFCYQCWPITEQCGLCQRDDLIKNPTHKHVSISTINYSDIQEDALLKKVEESLPKYAELKAKAEKLLADVLNDEKTEKDKIDEYFASVIKKIEALKSGMYEMVTSFFKPKSEMIEAARKCLEDTEKVINHSIKMMNRSQEIYKDLKVVTKLLKSKILLEKVSSLTIPEIPQINSKIPAEMFPFGKDILIDSNEAQFLEKNHSTLVSELEASLKIIEGQQEKEEHQKSEQERLEAERLDMEQKAAMERDALETKMKAYYERKWAADGKNYTFHKKVGVKGSQVMQFESPIGIAVHPITGHLYVADTFNNRIQVLNEELEVIRAFGSKGSGPGQFDKPLGISISPEGLVAVAENGSDRIQIFDKSDNVVETIKKGRQRSSNCTQTSLYNGFSAIWFLSFDREGNLYVANFAKNRVDKFNKRFEAETSFAKAADGETGISQPTGVCVTSRNRVCVIGFGGEKINIYDTEGKFDSSLPIEKVGRQASIEEGPNNTILVSDMSNSQIKVYDMGTKQLVHTIGSGKSSDDDGHFDNPTGLCFGMNQKLYVCDRGNSRIQAFSA